MSRAVRHISIRVPWHDTGWDGRVCSAPRLNGACLKLNRIASSRQDEREEEWRGRRFTEMAEKDWPPCIVERMPFMAPFEYTRQVNHPYRTRGHSRLHEHYRDTPLRFPAYSAGAVPFHWVLRENMPQLAVEHNLDVHDEREPDLGFPAAATWVQNVDNQKALLDCFREHIRAEQSLCFFYAKQVPFVEEASASRILIGVGRVMSVAPPQEYDYTTEDLNGKLRSMLWELIVQHSIRPEFQDGFLLPYHAAISHAAQNPEFDPADVVAYTPADRLPEFSYGSQLVSHDAAIGGLLSCATALSRAKGVLPGNWESCLQWIDSCLGEIWTSRGPYPGLGAALSAFGIEHGMFIAHSLVEQVGENGDPWPLVDAMLANPKEHLPENLASTVGSTVQQTWQSLTDERRKLLQLLSRFDLSPEQASLLYVSEERSRAGINLSDRQIVENPYTIFEGTRFIDDPVSVWTVDRGVFPPEAIRSKFPLPEPSQLDSGIDARRIRALCVQTLENAAASGNTVLPQDRAVLTMRDLEVQPDCPVTGDVMNVAKKMFTGIVNVVNMANDASALQLARLSDAGAVIRKAVEARMAGARFHVEADWQALLDRHLQKKGVAANDAEEGRARQEKVAALVELAASRLSVLVGPAGTGKTTLLSVLCTQPDIEDGGVLLLAPTGKARVRMEQSASELQLRGYTIAQFLAPSRYDVSTGRYHLSEAPTDDVGARTVIVDEASMLTEEMLGALLQALKGAQRLILIGDPRQLPPIGAGRPFVDIVNRLLRDGFADEFPRVARGYAELTVRRRQANVDSQESADLALADFFSGKAGAHTESDAFTKLAGSEGSSRVRFIRWDTPDDLRSSLLVAIVEELRLQGEHDVEGFDKTLGGIPWNDRRFFNPQNQRQQGAALASESWQILSPLRAGISGVSDLNRLVHKQFRQQMMDLSTLPGNQRKYPEPMGPERIVYGDKVINLLNTNPTSLKFGHRRVFPQKESPYIANGEMGMAVGYFWSNTDRQKNRDFRWKLEVEFSSQPGHKYTYTSRDFGEEGNPILELAYALTVHKAQGSEFGTVFLVLPNPCRLLSRELLYTALIRHKKRVVILHQGDVGSLQQFASDYRSEIARRLTNLFEAPSPVEVEGVLYEQSLLERGA